MRWTAEMTMISFSHMQMLYVSAYRDHFRLAIEEDGHKKFKHCAETQVALIGHLLASFSGYMVKK